MNATFQNQLTVKEINKGILVYLIKNFWIFLIFSIAIVVILFVGTNNWNILAVLLYLVLTLGITLIITFIDLRRKMSPKKIATYHLKKEMLEIVSSNGEVTVHTYDQVKVINSDILFVLFFTTTSFAIIAKRNLTEEQVAFLQDMSK